MFFFLPIGVDYQARRYPVVTFTIMGLCTLIFFGTLPGSIETNDEEYPWAFRNLWLIPAAGHWWTYITSMFVHGGFMHLFGNMIYLFLFGSCVEDFIGRFKFTIFYLVCGLASGLANIIFSAEGFSSEIPLGGASGAISGCIGGFLLLLPRTKIEFKWFLWFWFRFWVGEFFLPAWLVISFWFMQDFAGLMLEQSKEPGHGGVAFGAHVGGTLVGLTIISTRKLWLKEEEEEDDESETPYEPAARPVVRSRTPAPPPAVAETPSLYLFVNGSQAGPYTLTQVQQMLATGSIPADGLYWQEGMDNWRAAEELRETGLG